MYQYAIELEKDVLMDEVAEARMKEVRLSMRANQGKGDTFRSGLSPCIEPSQRRTEDTSRPRNFIHSLIYIAPSIPAMLSSQQDAL